MGSKVSRTRKIESVARGFVAVSRDNGMPCYFSVAAGVVSPSFSELYESVFTGCAFCGGGQAKRQDGTLAAVAAATAAYSSTRGVVISTKLVSGPGRTKASAGAVQLARSTALAASSDVERV